MCWKNPSPSYLTFYLNLSPSLFSFIISISLQCLFSLSRKAGRYKNTIDCVAKIFKEEGPLAFFKGLEATLWRHGVWNGGYFGVIG